MDDDTLGSEAAGASSHAPLCGDDEREAIRAKGVDPDDLPFERRSILCAGRDITRQLAAAGGQAHSKSRRDLRPNRSGSSRGIT
jgi:hypothetical protein